MHGNTTGGEQFGERMCATVMDASEKTGIGGEKHIHWI